jgi:hypothetical protein
MEPQNARARISTLVRAFVTLTTMAAVALTSQAGRRWIDP